MFLCPNFVFYLYRWPPFLAMSLQKGRAFTVCPMCCVFVVWAVSFLFVSVCFLLPPPPPPPVPLLYVVWYVCVVSALCLLLFFVSCFLVKIKVSFFVVFGLVVCVCFVVFLFCVFCRNFVAYQYWHLLFFFVSLGVCRRWWWRTPRWRSSASWPSRTGPRGRGPPSACRRTAWCPSLKASSGDCLRYD